MERRVFLSRISSKAVAVVGVSAGIFALEEYGPEIVLPGLRGPLQVRQVTHRTLIRAAQAQHYGYNYEMAPYQQWMAAQQAQIAYIQQMRQWQAQLAWLKQQHWLAMQALMQQYDQYQIGRPQAWEGAKSVYAYAQAPGGTVYMGANANADQVSIQGNLRAAETIFGRTNGQFSLGERQRAVGPQSDERRVLIDVPGFNKQMGTAYRTTNNAFAVTDASNFRANNGTIGQIAKFEIGPDGEKYEVI